MLTLYQPSLGCPRLVEMNGQGRAKMAAGAAWQAAEEGEPRLGTVKRQDPQDLGQPPRCSSWSTRVWILEPHCSDRPLSPSNSDDIREALQYAVGYASWRV